MNHRELFLSREQVRRIDADAVAELKIPGLLLMENAARGLHDVLLAEKPTGRIVILCGPGNNGGDGLALARLLSASGVRTNVRLLRDGRSLTPDAAANLSFLERSGVAVPELTVSAINVDVADLSREDWIVDALLGTGIRGIVRSPYDQIIAAINGSPARKLAADLPSGLDCETGQPCGICVRADYTVTFVARKIGFRNPHSAQFTGHVEVRPIGLPEEWLQRWLNRNGISSSC